MKYTEEKGVVKSVQDEKATVRLDHKRTRECGGCCACSAIAGGLPEIEVPREGLEEGQRVKVTIPRPNPYLSIILIFFFPLALLMGGIFIGQRLEEGPQLGINAAIGGVAGLILAMAAAWLANRFLEPDEGPSAEVIRE